MPPNKAKPKEQFFANAQKLLEDAQNSPDPELKKLRMEAARRYFAEDALGAAKISPIHGFYIGVVTILIFAGATFYIATRLHGAALVSVLVVFAFFTMLVLVLVLALAGVMSESTVSKTIVNLWVKFLSMVRKIPE
jgi:hypothetical protein